MFSLMFKIWINTWVQLKSIYFLCVTCSAWILIHSFIHIGYKKNGVLKRIKDEEINRWIDSQRNNEKRECRCHCLWLWLPFSLNSRWTSWLWTFNFSSGGLLTIQHFCFALSLWILLWWCSDFLVRWSWQWQSENQIIILLEDHYEKGYKI